MNIIEAIPYGRENAIPRRDLAAKLGVTDRKMREMVQGLRERGFLVMNAQDGRGYYFSSDLDEIERQYRQDTARAMSILKRRKLMRSMLKEAGRL